MFLIFLTIWSPSSSKSPFLYSVFCVLAKPSFWNRVVIISPLFHDPLRMLDRTENAFFFVLANIKECVRLYVLSFILRWLNIETQILLRHTISATRCIILCVNSGKPFQSDCKFSLRHKGRFWELGEEFPWGGKCLEGVVWKQVRIKASFWTPI